MTVITKITVGKKNKNRYNIFVDQGNGEEYGFSVSEDVLIKLDLKKGKVIDQMDAMEIAYQEDIQKGFTAALNFLSFRMRSEYEVKSHLQEKDYGNDIIKEVIHKLYQLKYLNDEEFAMAFVSTKINGADKGPIVIAQELKLKGVEESLIQKALLQYTDEKQLSHAIKLAEKMAGSSKKQSAMEMKRKAEQTLIRKGYASFIIVEALREVDFSQEEEAEWESLRSHGDKVVRKYSKYEGYEFKQKVKSALYRKGFPLELIERYLEDIQQEIGE